MPTSVSEWVSVCACVYEETGIIEEWVRDGGRAGEKAPDAPTRQSTGQPSSHPATQDPGSSWHESHVGLCFLTSRLALNNCFAIVDVIVCAPTIFIRTLEAILSGVVGGLRKIMLINIKVSESPDNALLYFEWKGALLISLLRSVCLFHSPSSLVFTTTTPLSTLDSWTWSSSIPRHLVCECLSVDSYKSVISDYDLKRYFSCRSRIGTKPEHAWSDINYHW